MIDEQELAACPFCGCTMRIESNRDWHRLKGDHSEECIFDAGSGIGTMPATDEDRLIIIEYWNRRTPSAAPASVPESSRPAQSEMLASVPGWVPVPVEATHEMCEAAHAGPNCAEHTMRASDREFWQECYRAMLAARPTAPAQPEPAAGSEK